MLDLFIGWILLGSLGTNLLWISWAMEFLPPTEKQLPRDLMFQDYCVGLLLGLFLGPFSLIFSIYKFCLIK